MAIGHFSFTVPTRKLGRQLHFTTLEILDRRRSFNFKQVLLISFLHLQEFALLIAFLLFLNHFLLVTILCS